ncbi:MAG: GGDEF domain-containing protein [Gammaproteobacteria bacterium]
MARFSHAFEVQRYDAGGTHTMSTPMKQITESAPWQGGDFNRDFLPFSSETEESRHLVSDSTKLRIATALQSSLHVRDIVRGFAREARRIVRGIVVRYHHSVQRLTVEDGAGEMNRYSYELNLIGKYLGEVTFSRHQPLSDNELATLEVLLCTLIYPLRNALQYESALRIALKDPLTGVSNRASMGAHLSHHISLAQRQHTPLSLLVIDIDHFKSVNDRYGHIVGDVVLTQVAQRIVSCTRTSDGVFRYGGEEFVVVLPSTDTAGAELLAERIRTSIESLSFDALPPRTRVTASVGVAHFAAGETETDLLQRADEVMLSAKRSGRNRVVVASTVAPAG